MKCLVVEDDVTSNKILNLFLSYFGECAVAFDGGEAIEAYRLALERNEPFDLICMDIMMPEVDGHQALEEIRKMEDRHGIREEDRAKVIMTTCLDEDEDMKLAHQCGCNAYMVKPIYQQSLMQQIEDLGFPIEPPDSR
jgi:two-component system, chemotaxis family, chemotaxis protein CheY